MEQLSSLGDKHSSEGAREKQRSKRKKKGEFYSIKMQTDPAPSGVQTGGGKRGGGGDKQMKRGENEGRGQAMMCRVG